MTELTWHQQRGVERRLGLHRWLSDDGGDACLHCGTFVSDELIVRDGVLVEYPYVPMTCSPNDARYLDEFRDDTYEPHRWGPWPEGARCEDCGFIITGDTLPDLVHEHSCEPR